MMKLCGLLLVSSFISFSSGNEEDVCPQLPQISYGEVNCTNGQNLDSVCTYRCLDNAYNVFPLEDNTLTCLPSGKWNKKQPCCALPCPPHAIFDFIVLKHVSNEFSIQTSNDIGREIPRKLVPFSDIGFSLARIQFSGDIHHSNKLLFNQFPSAATAINENSNDGQVNAGRALRWAYDNLRNVNSGNRQNIRDIVIVVSDKSFDDDVAEPAQAWRDAGALMFAERLPRSDGSYANFEQMLEITKDPSKIFTLKGRSLGNINSLLDEEIDVMCRYRCNRPGEI